MISNIIASGILVILIGSAITYIVRKKKQGVKCIGCPASGGCSCSCQKQPDTETHCEHHSNVE